MSELDTMQAAREHAQHTAQAPRMSTEHLETVFMSNYEIAMQRTGVLELTHRELKLMSEAKILCMALEVFRQPRPQGSKSGIDENAYRAALSEYGNELVRFNTQTQELFDTDQRLRNPWYSNAVKSGKLCVTLSERGTDASRAFVLIETLRSNIVEPKAPDFTKR